MKLSNKRIQSDIALIRKWTVSPISFIEDLWGLVPQPLVCKEEHIHIKRCYGEFIRDKHITWQQTQILEAVERAIKGDKRRISVVTGHGIGKTAVLSWLIHWFLLTRFNAQVGCTAPTSDQMYDVGWKELSIWHRRLPQGIQDMLEWSTTHFKVKERAETWWARARTARKEAPEAFAGLHGDYVMLTADEASGVPDEIYRTGEGSLTNKDVLVLLFSNGIRLSGFFFDTHHNDKENWQTLSFSSLDSPIVEPDYCDRIKAKYGEDSDEYRFMVLGLFPIEGGVEEGGWLPLINEQELKYTQDVGVLRNPKLGFDPAGSGGNKSVHVLRDDFIAKVVSTEGTSTIKSRAERTLTLQTHYKVSHENIAIDNFGIGANVAMDIAIADGKRVNAVNTGEQADDSDRFINKRAEDAWRAREWLIAGGQLVRHDGWKQLLLYRYKRTLAGKIQLMSKEEMRKRGLIGQSESPDCGDAFFLTFEGERVRTTSSKRDELSPSEIASITKIY